MGFQVKAITGADDTSGDNGYTLFPEPQSGKNQWTRQKGYIDPGKQIAFKKIIYLAFFLLWKETGLVMFTKPGEFLKLLFS